LSIYAVKLLIQAITWFKAMKQLNEGDLFPFFIFFDIWMFFLLSPFFFQQYGKKTKKNAGAKKALCMIEIILKYFFRFLRRSNCNNFSALGNLYKEWNSKNKRHITQRH